MSEKRPIVKGEVHFPGDAPPLRDATVRVRLEDASLADAPAEVVAEEVIHGLSRNPGDPRPVRFTVHGPAKLDERARYNLSVHVDLDGSGEIARGDFITMQTYPLSVDDLPAEVSAEVRRVG